MASRRNVGPSMLTASRRALGAFVATALVAASCANGSADRGSAPADETSTTEPVASPSDSAAVGSDTTSTGTTVPTNTIQLEPAATSEPDETDTPKARWETGSSDYLFDQEKLHTYELTISDENLEILDSDPTAEEYVEGSLTFEGETLDAVGIRYKGSVGGFIACTDGPNPLVPTGRKTCQKLSMKVKINWDDKKTEFYGLRRVQLHALNLDPSLMHDRLGYWLFAQAGVTSPRSTHARLVINGEFAGLFAMTEQIDGRMVRDRFADGTGNLYKEVWPFDGNGDVRSGDELIRGLKTNEDDDPDVELMQRFATEILDSGAPTDPVAAREVLDRWTDLDALVAYAVVDRGIAHDDGPFHWYCFELPCEPHNFYWYEDPTEQKLHLIAWDVDNAFDNLIGEANPITPIADGWGETQNDCEPFPFSGFGLLQRSAACDPLVAAWSLLNDEYQRTRSDFFAGPASMDRIREQVDAWSLQIAPVVAEAEQTHDRALSVADWQAAVTRLLDNLAISMEN